MPRSSFSMALKGSPTLSRSASSLAASLVLSSEEAKKIEAAAAHSEKAGLVEWLLQGTLYPDVIERSVKKQVSYLAMLVRLSRDFSSSLVRRSPLK
jgi:hypothetical protein